MRRLSVRHAAALAAGALAAGLLSPGCRPAAGDAPAATYSRAAAVAPAGARHLGTPTTPAPDYSVYDLPAVWRDQAGDTVRLPALAGRVRVMAMVYTSCQATCPLIVADLKRIEAALPPARRGDVGFVLVSLDPERDTPGRLAEWGAHTGLDPARWTLLAGDDDAVRELAATLDVRYQAQPGGELAHTNGLTVLDRAGGVAHRQVGLGETDATIHAVLALLR
jgi:protein SCO1